MYPTDVWECPTCLKQRRRPPDHKRLYNVLVCKKCRNGFASRRQAAYIVDVLLYKGMLFILMFSVGMLFLTTLPAAPATAGPSTGSVAVVTGLTTSSSGLLWDVATIMFSLILFPLLFALRDAFNGRSPGKWLFGLQVVDTESREPIDWMQSLKRNLILAIPYVNYIGVIGGCITMMKGRRWGDNWAKTDVVWLKHAMRPPFTPEGRCCRVCGYDLTGNVSGRCPECGTEILRPELVPPAS